MLKVKFIWRLEPFTLGRQYDTMVAALSEVLFFWVRMTTRLQELGDTWWSLQYLWKLSRQQHCLVVLHVIKSSCTKVNDSLDKWIIHDKSNSSECNISKNVFAAVSKSVGNTWGDGNLYASGWRKTSSPSTIPPDPTQSLQESSSVKDSSESLQWVNCIVTALQDFTP